jgi:hypothetical protein
MGPIDSQVNLYLSNVSFCVTSPFEPKYPCITGCTHSAVRDDSLISVISLTTVSIFFHCPVGGHKFLAHTVSIALYNTLET